MISSKFYSSMKYENKLFPNNISSYFPNFLLFSLSFFHAFYLSFYYHGYLSTTVFQKPPHFLYGNLKTFNILCTVFDLI
jgi:hypothetical protein